MRSKILSLRMSIEEEVPMAPEVDDCEEEQDVPMGDEDGAEVPVQPPRRPTPNIMTWLPRKSDYEIVQVIAADETFEEKEVVDGVEYGFEEKIYKTMDIGQDIESLSKLHKDCDSNPDAPKFADILKKCKVGIISLQNYLKQANVLEFANSIHQENLFKMGLSVGFGDWLREAEKRVVEANKTEKPKTFDEAKALEVMDAMAKLSERYFVLCKKAEHQFKTIQNLLVEWQRLDEFMEPTDPFKMDDYQTKQFVVFLRSYAAYFA
ncbi:unnamed protein product [Lepeophtheirus salmonis]|uniref:(salmon louse) hypothetical protein n=1 Tax=Lepeophtheirus salmonis TaxID=72036 RepID=A0A7R8HAR7_LEPSM|nr:unnamed protein product [Lepeophtheirus salmonis]CAF2974576.1 unnamed protein product [Lepeophtheirus salmonis]